MTSYIVYRFGCYRNDPNIIMHKVNSFNTREKAEKYIIENFIAEHCAIYTWDNNILKGIELVK